MTYYAWASSEWNLLALSATGLGLFETQEDAQRGPHLGHQSLYRLTVEQIAPAAKAIDAFSVGGAE